jgi:L-alanine-DL-glutamate epimerase-like enolase superfamily enzyme
MEIRQVDVSAYTIPTDFPEADGTIEWKSTTIVIVEVHAADQVGIGFTYGDVSAAGLIDRVLSAEILGRDAMSVSGCWMAMRRAVRNMGRPGIASTAIAAVDIALWDLKAKMLGLPLVALLGSVRAGVPVYGSGGFTSYPIERLQAQLADWTSRGITKVKMKVGTAPADDLRRVKAGREAIGSQSALFVDANGAYSRKQAIGFAEQFVRYGVTWFEEPVSSDDLQGLRLIRNRAPAGMEIAAGEYGYDTDYFRTMLEAGAVDVLQADATRCAGISGFLEAATLAAAHHVPLSSHTAPSIHVHVCCATPAVCHLEYFHDHVRIERMLFADVMEPVKGILYPDQFRPGLGLEFKRSDAARYAA